MDVSPDYEDLFKILNAEVNILDLPELIRSKRKANRPQDRLDVDKLTRRAKGQKR